jgi:CheY-like chemotaxis protein
VLLVDDEPVILEVGRSLLQHLGYTVLAAGGGREALDLFRASRGRIDAVILDLIMPGMGGGETFDLLRRIDPGIGVLLSSGYGVDSQAREILDRGCDGFIQKPYSVSALAEKLRCVLERRPPPRRGTAGAPDAP